MITFAQGKVCDSFVVGKCIFISLRLFFSMHANNSGVDFTLKR